MIPMAKEQGSSADADEPCLHRARCGNRVSGGGGSGQNRTTTTIVISRQTLRWDKPGGILRITGTETNPLR